jgi:hypothetical protein
LGEGWLASRFGVCGGPPLAEKQKPAKDGAPRHPAFLSQLHIGCDAVRCWEGPVNRLRLWRVRRFTLIHSAKAVSCILISARALGGPETGGGAVLHVGDGCGDVFHWFVRECRGGLGRPIDQSLGVFRFLIKIVRF